MFQGTTWHDTKLLALFRAEISGWVVGTINAEQEWLFSPVHTEWSMNHKELRAYRPLCLYWPSNMWGCGLSLGMRGMAGKTDTLWRCGTVVMTHNPGKRDIARECCRDDDSEQPGKRTPGPNLTNLIRVKEALWICCNPEGSLHWAFDVRLGIALSLQGKMDIESCSGFEVLPLTRSRCLLGLGASMQILLLFLVFSQLGLQLSNAGL